MKLSKFFTNVYNMYVCSRGSSHPVETRDTRHLFLGRVCPVTCVICDHKFNNFVILAVIS